MSSYWLEEPPRRRPWCNVCDEQIEDHQCYVLDPDFPFESCVHRKCMDKELGKTTKVNFFIRDFIENYIKDEIGMKETPTQEGGVFYWE